MFSSEYILDEFIEHPYSQSFAEGQSGELRCIAPNAVPKPEVVWYKDGYAIQRNQDGHIIHSNDDSLLISPVSLFDEGKYYCVATNIVGQRQSDIAVISVYAGVVWTENWLVNVDL
uniref:Ig-like domain-containing protein n=1 Tax=Syphacia muris TaxID=451379 RepID=A0A0N5AE68_9BILA